MGKSCSLCREPIGDRYVILVDAAVGGASRLCKLCIDRLSANPHVAGMAGGPRPKIKRRSQGRRRCGYCGKRLALVHLTEIGAHGERQRLDLCRKCAIVGASKM